MSVMASSSAVIPRSEIERIKLGLKSTQHEGNKLAYRLEERNKSIEKVNRWANTISAVQERKDHIKFDKYRQKEEESRRLDQLEAIEQQNIKKGIVLRANQMLWEQSDQVKPFRRQQILVDILHERDGQI